MFLCPTATQASSLTAYLSNFEFDYSGKSTEKLDWRTFIVFVALQCAAPFVALLLSLPEKVQRADGKRVKTAERISTVQEVKEVLKVLTRKDFLLVPALDWVDHGFGRGWAFYVMMQVNFTLAYNYGYWLAGYIAKDPAEVVRLTSIVRAVEAAGGAVVSGISSTHAPLIAALGLNFGLWGLAVIPTYFVAQKVGLTREDADVEKVTVHSD
ncbi:hypothetical protein N7481_003640 [Penicillium waksmanii]|uniref:uncharacterized protein n=1 Tax=Penicillium waksmanii TaxID=69791 RepID=UPI0025490BC8|nr:uncharacterized protein N7481_003640 [Penicillium waksmanii]KAJ5988430.1 hypothetical protein N7481_003640 [Penicillium waksmanii]